MIFCHWKWTLIFSEDEENAKPEALNKKALQIVKRVKDKLTGKYSNIQIDSVNAQIETVSMICVVCWHFAVMVYP